MGVSKIETAVSICRELLEFRCYFEVEEACRQLSQRYPNEPRFHAMRAVALGNLGRHIECRDECVRALRRE